MARIQAKLPPKTFGVASDTSAATPGWVLVLVSALLLCITMGIRQTVGLFVHPIAHGAGLDIVSISFALAVGQLLWGVFQPVFGAIADKKGGFGVLAFGAVLMAAGQAGTAWADSGALLLCTLGFLAPAGAAAGSFSILIGATAGQLPARMRSFAGGMINAGGSVGQFVFAPMVQFFIHMWGYASALFMLAAWALGTIPLARLLCPRIGGKGAAAAPGTAFSASAGGEPDMGLREQLRVALRNPSYILLHAGFFTCGFHVAFLVTHLPGEVAVCGHSAAVSAVSLSLIGLCNIAGSLGAGFLGNHVRMKHILAATYGARALMIAAFVAAPKTEMAFYLFAAATGLTWLATVPPTAGIVAKLFGVRYLATLFGLTLLTHQVGGFLGAYLGGLAVASTGNYLWMWHADIILAALAALVNLPIREAGVR